MNRNAWAPAARGGAFLPQVRLGGFAQPRLGNFGRPGMAGPPIQMAASRYTLGVTAQEWYNRAKAAMAQYELLLKKVNTIDNKTERDNILKWIGKASDSETKPAAYRYNTVKSDFVYDVAREGIGAYNEDRRQRRIEKLEDFNDTLDEMVDTALKVHGVRLPGETRIETREVISDLTVPIIAGAGILTAGIVLLAIL